MSSEMRKYVEALRDREHRFHGMGGHYVAEVIRGELEALLARTEAGADRPVAEISELSGAKLIVLYSVDEIGHLPKGTKLYLHPQDASAGAVTEADIIALVAGPYMYHHKMDDHAVREGKAFDRCRELTIQNIQTYFATRFACVATLQQKGSGNE